MLFVTSIREYKKTVGNNCRFVSMWDRVESIATRQGNREFGVQTPMGFQTL